VLTPQRTSLNDGIASVIVSKVPQQTRTDVVAIADDMSIDETINQTAIGHDLVEIMFRNLYSFTVHVALFKTQLMHCI
jgi:hypothetical protein